ncbi:MAG: hypothetical protein Q9181_004936 [Wetmoreana brouardii]
MAGTPPPRASRDKQRRKGAGRADGGYKIAGTVLPWDPDIDLDRPTPTPLFPPYKTTPPPPLTKTEKAQVAAFRSLRARIHEGPFYTVLGDDGRIGKTAKTSAANFDPFEGMPTYSQKYVKKRRRLPKLSTRPYVFKYFPKELWPTLDPKKYKSTNGVTSTINEFRESTLNGVARRKAVQELADRAASGYEGEEAATDERDPDEEAMEENMDDDFDEEDEDGGDYNAEQYFDDGGDDAGDDLDGGDAGKVMSCNRLCRSPVAALNWLRQGSNEQQEHFYPYLCGVLQLTLK